MDRQELKSALKEVIAEMVGDQDESELGFRSPQTSATRLYIGRDDNEPGCLYMLGAPAQPGGKPTKIMIDQPALRGYIRNLTTFIQVPSNPKYGESTKLVVEVEADQNYQLVSSLISAGAGNGMTAWTQGLLTSLLKLPKGDLNEPVFIGWSAADDNDKVVFAELYDENGNKVIGDWNRNADPFTLLNAARDRHGLDHKDLGRPGEKSGAANKAPATNEGNGVLGLTRGENMTKALADKSGLPEVVQIDFVRGVTGRSDITNLASLTDASARKVMTAAGAFSEIADNLATGQLPPEKWLTFANKANKANLQHLGEVALNEKFFARTLEESDKLARGETSAKDYDLVAAPISEDEGLEFGDEFPPEDDLPF